jgi:RNA recognition motif-containing protein
MQSGNPSPTGPHGCNLFIASLPPGTDDERLRRLFEPFGTIVSAKVMVDLKTKQLRNHGFVRFVSPDDAQAAINNMHRRKLDDHSAPIHVAVSTHNDSNKSTECEVIYVRNLPDKITVEHLRQAFLPFGNIVDVLLPSYSNSTHQGVGFVRFSTIDEARSAVERAHNTMPFGEGKAIQVRFKESKQMSAKRGVLKTGEGSPPGSGATSPTFHSNVASPNDPSLGLLGHTPHAFSLSVSSPPNQAIAPLSPGGMFIVGAPIPVPMSASPPSSPPQLNPVPGYTMGGLQPIPAMMTGPAPAVSSPVTFSLATPATHRPFPGPNDLYFANFGAREWLMQVITPWCPALMQPNLDGSAVVRLHDESQHYNAARQLNGISGPLGTPMTVALVRM